MAGMPARIAAGKFFQASMTVIRYAIFRTFENAVLKLDSGFVNEPYSKPEDCDE
jgi:hypothetical protein